MINWIKSWFKEPEPTEFDILEKEIKQDLDNAKEFEDLQDIILKLGLLVHHTRTYGEADRLKSLQLKFEIKQSLLLKDKNDI